MLFALSTSKVLVAEKMQLPLFEIKLWKMIVERSKDCKYKRAILNVEEQTKNSISLGFWIFDSI